MLIIITDASSRGSHATRERGHVYFNIVFISSLLHEFWTLKLNIAIVNKQELEFLQHTLGGI